MNTALRMAPNKTGAAREAFPPWAVSQEAEQSLLGAILLDNAVLPRIAELVSEEDFYTKDHAAIFKAAAAMISRGQVADVVTLTAHLEAENAEQFQAFGGAAYLGALAQNTPSALNAIRYAELVRDKAIRRRVDSALAELSRVIRAGAQRDTGGLIAEAQGLLSQLGGRLAWQGLRAINAAEFINMDLPPLEVLVEPWLTQKNLCMVHSKRGIGKTHFSFGLSYALATGGAFLTYRAPKPRRVLYVDGEMPMQLMQKRLRELAGGSSGAVPELLDIITPDVQNRPMPDLALPGGQAEIDAHVRDDTALIVVDNLSCLVRSGGAENEAEQWTPVAEWALRHRRAGRAVLFVHHSGKSGAQRGHSKREDLLDVVINLRRPGEYHESDGAVFEVHFEKGRDLHGGDIAPIEARLEQHSGGGYLWTYTSAATKTQDRIRALWDGGSLSLHDVMREIGCSKSHAHKTLEAAMQSGQLQRPYPQKPRVRKETK